MKKIVLLLVMCLPLMAQAQNIKEEEDFAVMLDAARGAANDYKSKVYVAQKAYNDSRSIKTTTATAVKPISSEDLAKSYKRDKVLIDKEFLKERVDAEQVLLDAALKDLKEWQEICQSECEHVKRARSDAGVIKVRLENAKKAYKKFCDEHPNL